VTNPSLKYGKNPPEHSPLTLRLDDYVERSVLPAPEVRRGWEYAVPKGTYGMLGNDQVGNCVIAAVLHFIQIANANAGRVVTFTTEQAIQLYSDVTGYNPSDPSTDRGTAWTAMLEYWRTKGVYGHFIKAWAAFDYTDPVAYSQAIDIFEAALIGIQVTGSMEKQFAAHKPCAAPFKGGVKGGHGVPVAGYGSKGRRCVTWNSLWDMAPEADKQIDEAYVVVTDDVLNKLYQTPLGINATALAADIEALRTK